MIRTQVLGLGSYVPDRVVTNDQFRFLNRHREICAEPQIDVTDEWIQTRTGIRERHFVPNDETWATSDLALRATQAALVDAKLDAAEIDCIILGTLSPDIHFPGTAIFLQRKLGIADKGCACYDIRQQCGAFVYGLQMADALIRAGLYRKVLLVGAELHSHALDYTTRGRDVTVLFGDGAGAMILGPATADDPGVLYTYVGADGRGAWDLYMQVYDIAKAPLVQYNMADPDLDVTLAYPQMDGKRVFVQAVRNMVMATQKALTETGLTWNDIDWFVPHQANLRINQKVVQLAEIPPDKVLNSIEFYGNTTAATVPLTIDHWRKHGKVKRGERILSAVFGSGYTWGSAIFHV